MRYLFIAAVVAAGLSLPQFATAGEPTHTDKQTEKHTDKKYSEMVATHAHANGVPEALVHRVIAHESRYNAHLIGRGGTIGLMQIKLETARGLGYTGDAAGLHDPNTNLTYGVKYLAGAYRAAKSDHDRAMRYYASGYYQIAKRQRLEAAKKRLEAAKKGLRPTVVPSDIPTSDVPAGDSHK